MSGEFRKFGFFCEFTLTEFTPTEFTPTLEGKGEGLLPDPCSLLPAPVIAENLIQNCLLNQFVVQSAPAFALYLQELQ